MLLYCYTVITLALNAFLLFGTCSDIKLSLTIGLVYSFFLFIAIILFQRQYNFSILCYSIAYWFLVSFVMNSIRNNGTQSAFNFESFLFNLIAVFILLALIAFFHKRIEALSPFQLLFLGQTLLALLMYFSNLLFNYFIFIYLLSVLFIILLIFFSNKQKPKVNYALILLVYALTCIVFVCDEVALIQKIYTSSWFQNYSMLDLISVIASMVVSLFCFVFELDFGVSLPTSDSFFSNAIKQNYNAMWKQSNMGLSPSSRRMTTSLVSWSLATPTVCFPVIYPALEDITYSYLLNKKSPAFTVPFDSSTASLSDLEKLDNDVASFIKEERKTSSLSKKSEINTKPETIGQSTFISRSVWNYTKSSILNGGAIRTYATIQAPLLSYELKVDFDAIIVNDLISKISEFKVEDLKYTFFTQVEVPILSGIIGTHHMALILISDGEHTFLVVLTTSKSIPLSDTTFNDEYKEKLKAKPIKIKDKVVEEDKKVPAVRTLYVSDKLLWDKTGRLKDQDKLQYMASTLFVVSKEIVNDLIKAGLKKDPDGGAKLEELYPELKAPIIKLFQASTFLKDGVNQIKVANLSKK